MVKANGWGGILFVFKYYNIYSRIAFTTAIISARQHLRPNIFSMWVILLSAWGTSRGGVP